MTTMNFNKVQSMTTQEFANLIKEATGEAKCFITPVKVSKGGNHYLKVSAGENEAIFYCSKEIPEGTSPKEVQWKEIEQTNEETGATETSFFAFIPTEDEGEEF